MMITTNSLILKFFIASLLYLITVDLSANENIELKEFVDTLCKEYVESKGTVGLSVAISQEDNIVLAKGYGLANLEHDIPVSTNTVFRIGSISKQFTAAAILLLTEQEKISLEDSIIKYLPDYPDHAKEVTIHHLLQHTSGIANFTSLPGYRKEKSLPVSQEEVINRFKDIPLEFKPGEKYKYNNSGYFLLSLIVENASGQTFKQFIEEHIFQKLNLKHTYCDHTQRIIKNRASGYSSWTGKIKNAAHIELNQTTGAGNLASTAINLVKWNQALLQGEILNEETLKTMLTRGTLNSGKSFNYGLGLRIESFEKQKVIRHAGGISGFRSDLVHFPEKKITIAVLSNIESTNTSKISNSIARFMINEMDQPKQ